jgi:hypothetical protein
MRIRRIGLFTTVLLSLFCAASAQSAETPPDPVQWTMSADGSRHEASGVNCAENVVGFGPLQFQDGDGANLLGACAYMDATGTGDAGLRVRRYAPGEGESREAISNDRQLMEPDPRTGAPLFTVRMTPATTRDGIMGGRVTITKVRNGYLVDCFAEGVTLQVASAKLVRVCSN